MHGLNADAVMERGAPLIGTLNLADDIDAFAEDYSRDEKKARAAAVDHPHAETSGARRAN
jgi:hypothetical protein